MQTFIKKISIFLIIWICFSINLQAEVDIWKEIDKGNKIIFIRHALAPGSGDPPGFNINDCKTQRNLNDTGIKQSKKIGKLFKDNQVKIDLVLTSEWCRCKDTARYAFNNFKEFSALNSTFEAPFNKNKAKQTKEIKLFVKKWKGEGKNLIFVTHYSVITEMTNAYPSSGEIIVTDKEFRVKGSLEIN